VPAAQKGGRGEGGGKREEEEEREKLIHMCCGLALAPIPPLAGRLWRLYPWGPWIKVDTAPGEGE